MLEQIITSSVLVISIVLIRVLLRGRLSARVRYALWLLVALRLLIPGSLFQVNQTPVRQMEQAVESVRYSTENREMRIVNDIESGKSPEQQVLALEDRTWLEESLGGTYEIQNGVELYSTVKGDTEIGFWVKIQKDRFDGLRVVWYLGMVLMVLWFLGTNLVFGLRLRKTAKRTDIPAARPVYTAQVPSPCVWGRRIYVTPPCLEDETRLHHVLAHEQAHLRHGDRLWSLVRCLCLIVWWFQPLVWMAASLSRKDCELAADEGAVKTLGEGERLAYGRTLLDIVAQRAVPGSLLQTATTMHAGTKSLKARILQIANHRTMKWYALLLAILLAAGAAACAFTGAKEIHGTPFNLPADLEGVDLEMETVVPGYFPLGLADYHKEGRFAALDELQIEFYSPSPDTTVFPEPGYWRENDGALHFRLSEDWGCIVTGGDVPTEELVKLVESFYVVSGPEPDSPELPAMDLWGISLTVEDATPIGCVVQVERDETAQELPLRLESAYWLERLDQEGWTALWSLEWTTGQRQINSGTAIAQNLLWVTEREDEYGILWDGRYRLGIQVRNMDNDLCRTYYAEFTVAWEDWQETLSYESILHKIDPDGRGYTVGLYLPEHGAQESLFCTDQDYLRRVSNLMASYRWIPLEEPRITDGLTVTLFGAASMIFTDCGGTVMLTIAYEDVLTRWLGVPLDSMYSSGDLLGDLRWEYDRLMASWERVTFSLDGGAEAAARHFAETAYGEHLMNQAPGSSCGAVEYELLQWECRKTSYDGTAVLGWFEAKLTPETGAYSSLWAGNSRPVEEGNYDGPLTMSREFVLQKQSDGLWHCIGLGSGGYMLPETTN